MEAGNVKVIFGTKKHMKKTLLLLGLVFTFAACTQCQDCTLDSVTSEVCKDDFDSNEDYQAALLAIEELGGDCK